MKHKVFLNKDRIVEVVLEGSIEPEEVVEIGKNVLDIQMQEFEDDPILLLVRIENEVEELGEETLKYNFKVYRDINFKKLAFVAPRKEGYFEGESHILKNAGKDPSAENIKMFTSVEEATSWLLDKK